MVKCNQIYVYIDNYILIFKSLIKYNILNAYSL